MVSSCEINLRETNSHVDNAFRINLSSDQLWRNQSKWDQWASMGTQVNSLPVSVFVEINFVFDEYLSSEHYISMLLQLDHLSWNWMAEFVTMHREGTSLHYLLEPHQKDPPWLLEESMTTRLIVQCVLRRDWCQRWGSVHARNRLQLIGFTMMSFRWVILSCIR